MKKFLFFVSVLSLAFTSCSGDESNNVNGSVVNKISFHNEGSDGRNYFLSYSEDQKLIEFDDRVAYKKVFNYTGDLITSINLYGNVNGSPYVLQANYNFEYDNQGRLLSFQHLENMLSFDRLEINYLDDTTANFTQYEIDFQNQLNVIATGKIIFNENNVLSYTISNNSNYTYESIFNYDNKQHIFSNVKGYRELMLFNIFAFDIFSDGISPHMGTTNNLISVEHNNYNNMVLYSSYVINHYSYNYNNNRTSRCNHLNLGSLYMEYHY